MTRRRFGNKGLLQDIATVVTAVLEANTISGDFNDLKAVEIPDEEAKVLALQPTYGLRVSFVLSGHALARMGSQEASDALSRLKAAAESPDATR